MFAQYDRRPPAGVKSVGRNRQAKVQKVIIKSSVIEPGFRSAQVPGRRRREHEVRCQAAIDQRHATPRELDLDIGLSLRIAVEMRHSAYGRT